MATIDKWASLCEKNVIDKNLFNEYKVFRGLRDENGNGVLAGLTNITSVTAKKVVDGVETPMDGQLYYRGYKIGDIVNGFLSENRFGFEETTYLLLFGELPSKDELEEFRQMLSENCTLPVSFTRDIIMKAHATDIMNAMSRAVLMLHHYDENPDDTSVPNVLRQSLRLIAQFPLLAVYAYHAYNHYENDESLIIRPPLQTSSIAETILRLLRHDAQFTPLEAKILDMALVLHADHGGGNNSAFAVRVVTSSGTDTYSAIAAALGSLKGPRHGGANIMVAKMIDDLKQNVTNWHDEGQVADYLKKLLNKEAFDRTGLIYGIGHAIYSISDPRERIFESFVRSLSAEKNREDEFALYSLIAQLAPELISKNHHMYKGVSANIDFYSGFVYDMLGLPRELYAPIFAVSRISGWCAHRIEEIVTNSRIIRPAYKSVAPVKDYVPIDKRP